MVTKWTSVNAALPDRWERVAVLLFDKLEEPEISHIDKRSYFDAQGQTFSKTVWVGIEGQVLFWAKLPPLPTKGNDRG